MGKQGNGPDDAGFSSPGGKKKIQCPSKLQKAAGSDRSPTWGGPGPCVEGSVLMQQSSREERCLEPGRGGRWPELLLWVQAGAGCSYCYQEGKIIKQSQDTALRLRCLPSLL